MTKSAILSVLLLVAFSALTASFANAQTEPAPPSAPAVSAPPRTGGDDIVLLKDGGMVRGTIEEIVPSKRVIITTRSGERRQYALSYVTYAGPESGAPRPGPTQPPQPVTPAQPPASAPPPARSSTSDHRDLVTVIGREARLHLRASKPGVTFHRKSATAISTSYERRTATGFDVMCTAPCEVAMPEGTYSFAISEGDDAPGEAEPVIIPAGGSTVYGEYESQSALRMTLIVGGWTLAAAGVFVAYTSFTAKEARECAADYCRTVEKLDPALFALGGVMMLAGSGVALFGPSAVKDKGHIRLVPGPPAPVAQAKPALRTVWDPLAGARVSGQF